MEIGVIILILVSVYLGYGLLNAHKKAIETERLYRIEREALIKENALLMDKLREKFEGERQIFLDKLLVRNGVSPVYKEREAPVPHVIKSTLTKKAELKEEMNHRRVKK